MKTIKKEFGVFTYNKNNDECTWQEYFDNETDALKNAEDSLLSLDDDSYIEVWEKENGFWGASGEPIFKSDK